MGDVEGGRGRRGLLLVGGAGEEGGGWRDAAVDLDGHFEGLDAQFGLFSGGKERWVSWDGGLGRKEVLVGMGREKSLTFTFPGAP